MKRLICCVLLLAFMVCSSPAWAKDGKVAKAKADVVVPGTSGVVAATWADIPSTTKAVVNPSPDKRVKKATLGSAAAKVARSPGIPIGVRLELGLTYSNLKKVVGELHDEGELDDLTQDELEIIVLTKLSMQNPKGFAKAASLPPSEPGSILSILVLLRKWIPLILSLLEMIESFGF